MRKSKKKRPSATILAVKVFRLSICREVGLTMGTTRTLCSWWGCIHLLLKTKKQIGAMPCLKGYLFFVLQFRCWIPERIHEHESCQGPEGPDWQSPLTNTKANSRCEQTFQYITRTRIANTTGKRIGKSRTALYEFIAYPVTLYWIT